MSSCGGRPAQRQSRRRSRRRSRHRNRRRSRPTRRRRRRPRRPTPAPPEDPPPDDSGALAGATLLRRAQFGPASGQYVRDDSPRLPSPDLAGPVPRARGRASAASLILLVVAVALADRARVDRLRGPGAARVQGRGHAHQAPLAGRLARGRSSTRSSASRAPLQAHGPALDLERRAQRRLQGPPRRPHGPQGDGDGGPRRRRPFLGPVRVSELRDPEVDLPVLGPRPRLRRRAQGERPGGTQRAPAGDDLDLRTYGGRPLGRDGLGQERRPASGSQRTRGSTASS